ncbi:MAG TPA: hypothetical protein VES66_10930 [Terriglobales bacterium]|nr:hypothetical protein [Terriglobales bacterium]
MDHEHRAESQTPAVTIKKPYTKPTCVSEDIFETTALACGKRPGGGGFCAGHPRNS